MTQYTIKLYNQSSTEKSYFAFTQLPKAASNDANPDIYSNAWASFPTIAPGNWDTALYAETSYASWAESPQEPSTMVDADGPMPVDAAPQDSVAFSNGDARDFTTLASAGSAHPGAFQTVGETDFTPLNNLVFGLARPNGSAIPAPVAMSNALPNETSNDTPVTKFYISDGSYTPGQVIDVSAMSTAYATIDFTGQPSTTATVTQDAKGAFTVTYG